MTEAAKAPKPNQQSPQVTIFDLQVHKLLYIGLHTEIL